MIIKIMSSHSLKPLQTITDVKDFEIKSSYIRNCATLEYYTNNSILPQKQILDFDYDYSQYITVLPDNYMYRKEYIQMIE